MIVRREFPLPRNRAKSSNRLLPTTTTLTLIPKMAYVFIVALDSIMSTARQRVNVPKKTYFWFFTRVNWRNSVRFPVH